MNDDGILLGVCASALILAVTVYLFATTTPWMLLLFTPYLLGWTAVALYYGLPPLWAWMWK